MDEDATYSFHDEDPRREDDDEEVRIMRAIANGVRCPICMKPIDESRHTINDYHLGYVHEECRMAMRRADDEARQTAVVR